MYAAMAKRTPALPLIDGGATRMQPVWVRDVAAGAQGRLLRGLRAGQRGAGFRACAPACLVSLLLLSYAASSLPLLPSQPS